MADDRLHPGIAEEIKLKFGRELPEFKVQPRFDGDRLPTRYSLVDYQPSGYVRFEGYRHGPSTVEYQLTNPQSRDFARREREYLLDRKDESLHRVNLQYKDGDVITGYFVELDDEGRRKGKPAQKVGKIYVSQELEAGNRIPLADSFIYQGTLHHVELALGTPKDIVAHGNLVGQTLEDLERNHGELFMHPAVTAFPGVKFELDGFPYISVHDARYGRSEVAIAHGFIDELGEVTSDALRPYAYRAAEQSGLLTFTRRNQSDSSVLGLSLPRDVQQLHTNLIGNQDSWMATRQAFPLTLHK